MITGIIGFGIGLIVGILLVVNIKKDVRLNLSIIQTNYIDGETESQ